MKDLKLTIKSGKITDICEPDSAGCDDKLRLLIPKDAVAISEEALAYLGSVDEIEVDADNPSFRSDSSCLLSKDGSKLIKASVNADISRLTGLRVIGSNAFNNMGRDIGRIEIRLPEGVTEIEYRAFAMSAEEARITVPSSVVTVGALAFMIHADKVTVEFKGDPDVEAAAFGTRAEHRAFTDTVLNVLPEVACTDQSTYTVICPANSKLAAYCAECGI